MNSLMKKVVAICHFFPIYTHFFDSKLGGIRMENNKNFEVKIDRTTYIVEVENVENSKVSAVDLLKGLIIAELE